MKVLNSHNKKLKTEWDKIKNHPIKIENVTEQSNKKFWWTCSVDSNHKWLASLNNRYKGKGCPYCANRKVSKTNNLKYKFPEIANEWHPNKNGNLKPDDFVFGSTKKVWWLCKKDPMHAWETQIRYRVQGKGCPFCANIKHDKLNSLQYKFPEIANEWHPNKNGNLKPEDFAKSSNKKVWWVCHLYDDQ